MGEIRKVPPELAGDSFRYSIRGPLHIEADGNQPPLLARHSQCHPLGEKRDHLHVIEMMVVTHYRRPDDRSVYIEAAEGGHQGELKGASDFGALWA